MIRQGRPIWGLLLGTIVSAGCDRPPAPPPATERTSRSTQPAEPAPAVPTTQELMSGPYKKLALAPLPLSASVPKSWEIYVPEGARMTFLQGPGLGGQSVRISLETGAPVPASRLPGLLDGAKKAAEKNKLNTRLCEVRAVGDTQILEEQKLYHPSDNPQQSMIEWRVTYFVHRELDYAPYVLDVLGLTSAQYDESKDLLRKIFDTIAHDPASGTL